jgi:hypothetical protein
VRTEEKKRKKINRKKKLTGLFEYESKFRDILPLPTLLT